MECCYVDIAIYRYERAGNNCNALKETQSNEESTMGADHIHILLAYMRYAENAENAENDPLTHSPTDAMKSKYKVSSALGIDKSLSKNDMDLLCRLSTKLYFFFSHIWIAGVSLLTLT